VTTPEPGIQSEAPDAPFEPRRRQVESLALFRGHREIVILHQGTEYRLRITKGDKLILTK
jgi:hemin uptake protein HemP